MTDGASELSPIARAAASIVAPRTVSAPASVEIPVILRATHTEAAGALMRVGGVRVVDRAIRQLARLRDARIVIATDGTIPLPRRLPPNVQRRDITGDGAAGIAALHEELGPDTKSVGADIVWLVPSRFDRGIRVIDAQTRRAATNSVYGELEHDPPGIFDRLINRKLSIKVTRLLFANLPVTPALLTLLAGFVGVYGALVIANGGSPNVVVGFAALQGYIILDGCAAVLARLRLHQSALGAWLDTMTGDFVSVVLTLAVGRALWGHGGTALDMKIAVVAAALTLLYALLAYRELVLQHESDVSKLRWWFAYGQTLRTMTGAGSHSIKALAMIGRRDAIVGVGLGLAVFDQLPLMLLFLLIVAISRAVAVLVQLFTPDWRFRPHA